MGILSWIKSFCWHDWHYHKTCLGSTLDPNCGNISRARTLFHQRICLKCGKWEDTITHAIEAVKKRREVREKERELGEGAWKNRCSN